MTVTAPAVRPPGTTSPGADGVRPSTRITVYVLWFIVVLGVQPWTQSEADGGSSSSLYKGGALLAVFLVALMLAPQRLRLRIPGVWAVWFLYLGIVLCASVLLPDALTPMTRVARFGIALVVPLLLWDVLRRDSTLLLRAHLAANTVLALLFAVGPFVAGSAAWENGGSFASGSRLQGALLATLPPGVGEVGAIVAGLALVAWAYGHLRWWLTTPLVALGLGLIITSRTRTAALALLVGLIIAALVTLRSRGGRHIAIGLAICAVPLLAVAPAVVDWALRGQSTQRFQSLSGRTLAWNNVLSADLPPGVAALGHGLGTTKILVTRGQGDVNTVPIDNSWLSLYWESGLIGAAVILVVYLCVLVTVLRAPTAYPRAASVLLVVLVGIASFSESGLSDLSSLTLALVVAAYTADLDRWLARRRPPDGDDPAPHAEALPAGAA